MSRFGFIIFEHALLYILKISKSKGFAPGAAESS